MGKELVSIIVPIYNVEKYIKRCVESLEKQTYTDLEILLVDDGSTDKSGEICENLKRKNKKINVIHTPNRGVSHARNTGLKNCKGKYVLFVDADDTIAENMVLILKKVLEEAKADIALCNYYEEYESGKKIYKRIYLPQILNLDGNAVEEFLKIWSPCGRLYRREILRGIFFPDLKYGEDLVFNAKLVLENRIQSFVSIDKGFYNYFLRSNSAMRSGFKEEWFIELCEEINIIKELEKKFNKKLNTNLVKNGTLVFINGYASMTAKEIVQKRELLKKFKKSIRSNKEFCFQNTKKNEKVRFGLIIWFPEIYIIMKKIYNTLKE